MHDDRLRHSDEEHWVVWNGAFGIAATATLGRVEFAEGGRRAWLDQPFDMVGPFSLEELEARGRIDFAACIVMSRQRWQDDQVDLRRESRERRRAAQERLYEEHARFHGPRGRRRTHGHPFREREHREALNLPIDGKLKPAQIKAAFRKLAQKVHPDVGGSHEQFIRITDARNALLADM